MNKHLIIATLLIVPLATNAEEPVKFPTGPKTWDIRVTPSKLNGPPDTPNTAPRLLSVTVTQDNSKRRYQTTYTGGNTCEAWELPQYQMTMAETPGGSIAMIGLPPETTTPFGPAAFEWLKPEHLKTPNPQTHLNKPCWHYEGTRNIQNDEGETINTLKCAAWIDAETLLPVTLDDGVNCGTYKFHETAATLEMPAKFQKKLNRHLLYSGQPLP
jgi:hypothetical protein